MVLRRRADIADVLRRRVLRGLAVGAIAPGGRLPSTRELAAELSADPRVVAAAYRALATEGLVELRARSGVFVSRAAREGRGAGTQPEVSALWAADVLAAGIMRGIAAPDLPRTLAAALGAKPVRAVVVATTIDQGDGICRELREDFGCQSRVVPADAISPRAPAPAAVRRAHLLVTTELHRERVAAVASRLGKRLVSVSIRPDLFEIEWAVLRGQRAWVLVADPRFARFVRDYLERIGADAGVTVLLAGRDDLSDIPPDAPVYATQSARARIGATRLPSGLLPPARMLSEGCAREILAAVIAIQDERR